ncbi:hypothetical protein SteCoe_26926 [Stentor coeruleus]|uniref:Uncharacterized protein n=1 Tax=Stentor coeruleus TaxID=5963 RepID=A0A1R2BBN1_9CILI|nr:hypothetical protein SteCoe_26926 [Stentor coeruleus]
MTEAGIIELLSNVSEDVLCDSVGSIPIFDADLSAWKSINTTCSNAFKLTQEPVRIRIRTVEICRPLTRNSSSTFSSSNNSRSSSPCTKNLRKMKTIGSNTKKVVCFTMSHDFPETLESSIETLPQKSIRIYKPNGPRRKRKPIKVFRLPKVIQGSNDE